MKEASYVTNDNGQVTQTLNYLPYGDAWVDLQYFDLMPAENNLGVYKFNGKEKDAESGYNYCGARYYDSEKLSWLSVDPMSDKYPNLSPYVYCADNPVKLIDPNGEEIGDYYNNKGEFLGTDGINDGKVYVLKDKFEEKVKTDVFNGGLLNKEYVKFLQNSSDEFVYNQTELNRYAANVYNESYGMSQEDKNKIASAMENRLKSTIYKGDVIKMTDKLMFWNDNHSKKMREIERKSGNKRDYPPKNANNFTYESVSTENYRRFINTSKINRNNSGEMRGAIKAVINQGKYHPNLVNGKQNWRGNGKENRFF
jgi:RHS repeat-associated protein